jgi:choline-glycine betaine transporter
LVGREERMELLHSGLIVPLASFVMVVLIVAIASFRKMREKELEAHRELRMREMEHERKMKEMEIEKSRLELEKSKLAKNA